MISIIIPFKNCKSSILDTLHSVKSQSILEWECILVDDNSNDNSHDIIKHFIADDRHFHLKYNEGKGGNGCRNTGIKYSSKPYVLFLDADDRLEPTCIQQRLEFISKHPDCEIIISQTKVFNEHEDVTAGIFKPQSSDISSLILYFINHKIQWNTTGPTWKRSFLNKIGRWNEEYPRLQDVELSIRALLDEPKIAFIPSTDSVYNISSFSKTKQYNAQFGFLYLIRDYYKPIIQKYKEKHIVEQFTTAFQANVQNLKNYYSSRETWYNPYYINEFIIVVSAQKDLYDVQELKSFFAVENKFIFPDLSGNKFIKFIKHLFKTIINREGAPENLWNGQTGDLLFTLYASEYIAVSQTDIQKIKSKLTASFNSIKRFQSSQLFSYWDGVNGIVQVFEILDKNGIIETDIGKVLLDYTEKLMDKINTHNHIEVEELPYIANMLINRIKHFDEMGADSNLAIEGKITLINIVNILIEHIQVTIFNYYEDKAYIILKILVKIYSLDIYSEVIIQAIDKITVAIQNQLKGRKHNPTVTLLNNLCAYEYVCKRLGINSKIDIDTLLRTWINNGVFRHQKIEPNYLFHINMMIHKYHTSKNGELKNWIKSQLNYDISFALAQGCEYKAYQFGLVGLSGIGLTTLSFLSPNLVSWDEILMVS